MAIKAKAEVVVRHLQPFSSVFDKHGAILHTRKSQSVYFLPKSYDTLTKWVWKNKKRKRKVSYSWRDQHLWGSSFWNTYFKHENLSPEPSHTDTYESSLFDISALKGEKKDFQTTISLKNTLRLILEKKFYILYNLSSK